MALPQSSDTPSLFASANYPSNVPSPENYGWTTAMADYPLIRARFEKIMSAGPASNHANELIRKSVNASKENDLGTYLTLVVNVPKSNVVEFPQSGQNSRSLADVVANAGKAAATAASGEVAKAAGSGVKEVAGTVGAAIGSAFGPLGTVVGGLLGTIGGALCGGKGSSDVPPGVVQDIAGQIDEDPTTDLTRYLRCRSGLGLDQNKTSKTYALCVSPDGKTVESPEVLASDILKEKGDLLTPETKAYLERLAAQQAFDKNMMIGFGAASVVGASILLYFALKKKKSHGKK